MKVRKLLRSLALGALTVGLMLPSIPSAHASGSSPVIIDSLNDVIDIVEHSQNSFRPSTSPFVSPHTEYQHACEAGTGSLSTTVLGFNNCGPFDVKTSQVSSDSTLQKINFSMTTKSNIPLRGAALSQIPTPFTGVNYAWYFATSSQERPLVVGINCTGVADAHDNKIRDDFTVGTPPTKVGAEITYTKNHDCPAAANPDAESKGIASGGTRGALGKENVMSVVHPKSDGWMTFVEMALVQSSNGAKRLDGVGNLVCAGGAPLCIDYDFSIGYYEGYSGVSVSNSKIDFDAATQSKLTFAVSGSTVTASIPWNPTTISGTDGDLVLDDARSFPWPLAEAGKNDKMSNFVAEVSGVAGVGVNTVAPVGALCLDSTDNIVPESAEPIRSAGAALGTVNRTIANTTDDVYDAIGQGEPGTDDGEYIFGSGGTDQGDCIRGITGLLTILDWTDNGFELRIYPRNPGYLPGTGVDCRYPIGEYFGAAVLVTAVTMDPISAPVIDVGTSPYDKPYTVSIFTGSGTGSPNAGPTIADPLPAQNPLGGTIGKDKPCNYTYHAPGIHYFDIFTDIPM